MTTRIIPITPFEQIQAPSSVGHGFSFHCTQCGKCCSDGPQLTFAEAFALRDILPMRLMISTSVISVFDSSSKKQASTLVAMGFPMYQEGGMTYILNISPSTYQYQTGRCIALADNNQCGIYDKRPSICKSVPMATLASDDSIPARLDSFGKEFGCIQRQEDSAISVDGLNFNRKEIYDEIPFSSIVAGALMDLVDIRPGRMSIDSTHIAMLLDVQDRYFTGVQNGRGVQFAQSQLALLTRLVDDALQRKRKEDRKITKSYQETILMLRAFIEKEKNIPV